MNKNLFVLLVGVLTTSLITYGSEEKEIVTKETTTNTSSQKTEVNGTPIVDSKKTIITEKENTEINKEIDKTNTPSTENKEQKISKWKERLNTVGKYGPMLPVTVAKKWGYFEDYSFKAELAFCAAVWAAISYPVYRLIKKMNDERKKEKEEKEFEDLMKDISNLVKQEENDQENQEAA